MRGITQSVLAVAVLAAGTLHAQAPTTLTATGVVKAVSKDSLTVATAKHDIAFVISKTTRTVGKGLYSDLVLRDPPRNGILDLVKPGDRVTVTYRITGSAMNAVVVRKR